MVVGRWLHDRVVRVNELVVEKRNRLGAPDQHEFDDRALLPGLSCRIPRGL
jgi:hypothetical protein